LSILWYGRPRPSFESVTARVARTTTNFCILFYLEVPKLKFRANPTLYWIECSSMAGKMLSQ
ncbi:MAG: hypothetical protein SAK29_32695, partial [Scytonema sp. PMC 1069.18]|nr:hypothetical protein [Scytonema sp. PMC 1069.18]